MRLTTSATGAMQEMRACADLLARGYSVFRAVSPDAQCDILILLESRVFRVEVTTWTPREKFERRKYAHKTKNKHRFDLLCLVMHDGRILYRTDEPELAHLEALTDGVFCDQGGVQADGV